MCPGSPQKRLKRGPNMGGFGNDMDDWLVLVGFQHFSNFHTLWRRCPNDDQFDSSGWHLQPGGAKIEGQNPPTWDAGFSYITYVTVEHANTNHNGVPIASNYQMKPYWVYELGFIYIYLYTNVPQPKMKLHEFLKIYCWWFRNPAPSGMYKNLVNNGKNHQPQLVFWQPGTWANVAILLRPPEDERMDLSGIWVHPVFCCPFLCFYPWFCCKTMLKLLYFQSMLLNVYIEISDENDWILTHDWKMSHDLGTVRCRWVFLISFLAPFVHCVWMDAPCVMCLVCTPFFNYHLECKVPGWMSSV